MACCGAARQTYGPLVSGPGAFRVSGTKPLFQYTGLTSMTVTGAATGRTYRFDRPGARAEVDPRDQESVARVPNLRRIPM